MSCIQCVLNTVTEWTGVKAVRSVLRLKPERHDVVLDVPSYSQIDDYSCGAIAAWSILETFHPSANFWAFYRAVCPEPGEGVGPRRVVAALRKFRVGTRSQTRMGWKEIRQTLDQGFPMLIGTGKENPYSEGDHWSLLYGYGTRSRKVYLGNHPGLLRNQVCVGWGEFLEQWWNPKGKAIVCWGL